MSLQSCVTASFNWEKVERNRAEQTVANLPSHDSKAELVHPPPRRHDAEHEFVKFTYNRVADLGDLFSLILKLPRDFLWTIEIKVYVVRFLNGTKDLVDDQVWEVEHVGQLPS